jgi:hypothetical protein
MIYLEFTEEEKQSLYDERFHHPHPRVQRKMEARVLILSQAIATIELLTGIKPSPTQVRKFLKSMGMRCLKVGQIPSKADPDRQEEYQKISRLKINNSHYFSLR